MCTSLPLALSGSLSLPLSLKALRPGGSRVILMWRKSLPSTADRSRLVNALCAVLESEVGVLADTSRPQAASTKPRLKHTKPNFLVEIEKQRKMVVRL